MLKLITEELETIDHLRAYIVRYNTGRYFSNFSMNNRLGRAEFVSRDSLKPKNFFKRLKKASITNGWWSKEKNFTSGLNKRITRVKKWNFAGRANDRRSNHRPSQIYYPGKRRKIERQATESIRNGWKIWATLRINLLFTHAFPLVT